MKSMLKCHLAVLWSRKVFWAIGSFIFLMLCVAMAFAGWFESIHDMTHAGWVLFLLWNYAVLFLLVAHDHGKSEFFLAMGMEKDWCRAEIVLHICFSVLFALIWAVLIGISHGFSCELFQMTGCMGLFSVVFAQAALGNLQTRIIGLVPAKKMALFAVVSAPWALTAWIIGLLVSNKIFQNDNPELFILLLLLLGIFQIILGLLFRDEPALRRKKYQDEQ